MSKRTALRDARVLVHQTLTHDTTNEPISASLIVDAKCRAFVVSEIKLGKLALQMLLADVMVNAMDATLENGKITLNRVRVSISTNVFADAVVHGLVFLKETAETLGGGAFVRVNDRRTINVGFNNRF